MDLSELTHADDDAQPAAAARSRSRPQRVKRLEDSRMLQNQPEQGCQEKQQQQAEAGGALDESGRFNFGLPFPPEMFQAFMLTAVESIADQVSYRAAAQT